MEENNKHVQPNSKEEGVQRLNRILSESLIKATDTYKTPPQIIWVDNSSIATLGNFSASTGKAKAKKTFNVSALVAASLANGKVLNYRASLPEGKRKILYVDTEQSRYHCHNVLERILKLAGLPTSIDNENLDFICLREYTPSVRIEVIDYALAQDQSYGLVIIDGIRDLLPEHQLMLDEGEGWGYSCLTMIDRETIGILYESSAAHMTFQAVKLKDLIR